MFGKVFGVAKDGLPSLIERSYMRRTSLTYTSTKTSANNAIVKSLGNNRDKAVAKHKVYSRNESDYGETEIA